VDRMTPRDPREAIGLWLEEGPVVVSAESRRQMLGEILATPQSRGWRIRFRPTSVMSVVSGRLIAALTAAAMIAVIAVPLWSMAQRDTSGSGNDWSPCTGNGVPGPNDVLDGVWSRSGEMAVLREVDGEVWMIVLGDSGRASLVVATGSRLGDMVDLDIEALYSPGNQIDGRARLRVGHSPSGERPARLLVVSAPASFGNEPFEAVCPAPDPGEIFAATVLPPVVNGRPLERDAGTTCQAANGLGPFWQTWTGADTETAYFSQLETSWWLVAYGPVTAGTRRSVVLLSGIGTGAEIPLRWADLFPGASGTATLIFGATTLRVIPGSADPGIGTLRPCEFG
jgi:hypothetical protein